MALIHLPRRGVRSVFVISVLLWLGYQLARRLDFFASGTVAKYGLGDPFHVNPREDRDSHHSPGELEPVLALGSKQLGKLIAPIVGNGSPAHEGKRSKKTILPRHKYLENGLLQVNPKGQHPIYELLAKGKEVWEGKLNKASKTLGQAVDEYRRRYGRAPPKGFDKWWKYATENNVQLPDEYDQIHKDLEPFHALTSTQIQALVKTAASKPAMYTINCPGAKRKDAKDRICTYTMNKGGLNKEGLAIAEQRVKAQMAIIRDVQEDLEEVQAVFYSHDVPWQFVGHEYKGALTDAAEVGEFLNVEEHDLDWAHLGWSSACAPHKPLRKSYEVDVLPELQDLWDERAKTFIWDHKAAMDPCTHPTMTHLQGFLSGHGKGPGPSKELYPVMAMCKTTLHSDVLAVSMEAWTEDVGVDPPWDEKLHDRLLWRGKTTGIFFKPGVPWNISQRVNLVSRTAQISGHVPVLPLTPLNKAVGAPHNQPLAQLNRELMDVAFVDEPIQCEPAECAKVKAEYKFGSRLDWTQGNQYKYLLDIDGNGWSARFKRLMTTNSVILKSTIFPEWYTDRIQPWVHYIPIKSDLADLYDVLTFFRANHDQLAKRIASEGKKWSKTFWRKEDMISYQFRLFLELSRLQAHNREAASFSAMGKELDK